jgi:hypothetical protein
VDSLDLDWRLRLAAFASLRTLRDAAGGIVRLADLERGFDFEGERIPLINARRGIWRPRQFGSDDGWFVYRYEGDDPNLWTNRAVRRAMELRRPLVPSSLRRTSWGAPRGERTPRRR